mmetsp:Transcript_24343/g.34043  ORF Transcript_24343/g.34043 Transcript_24343/m.34043 type:complete len:200 (+) Transcript_24343:144-743(+)
MTMTRYSEYVGRNVQASKILSRNGTDISAATPFSTKVGFWARLMTRGSLNLRLTIHGISMAQRAWCFTQMLFVGTPRRGISTSARRTAGMWRGVCPKRKKKIKRSLYRLGKEGATADLARRRGGDGRRRKKCSLTAIWMTTICPLQATIGSRICSPLRMNGLEASSFNSHEVGSDVSFIQDDIARVAIVKPPFALSSMP